MVQYDTRPPFGLGLDHQFLGLFQHETGAVFTTLHANGLRDPFSEYGGPNRLRLNFFDPKAEWLINHQNARPYGTETVPASEEARRAAAGEGEHRRRPAGAGRVVE